MEGVFIGCAAAGTCKKMPSNHLSMSFLNFYNVYVNAKKAKQPSSGATANNEETSDSGDDTH